ncbi:MAG: GntR family transcriptional regulator [Eubacteriales bacterium]|nr:GntR family transcriptional regulator [Eubacteriales bacterium]
MAWNFTSQQPIYQQIVDYILMDILSGKYSMGEKLPSVRDLSLVASVNPNTMQRAMSELESLGLAETQRNSGRFVTTQEAIIATARKQKAMEAAKTYLNNMKALGYTREEALELLRGDACKEE